MKRKTLIKSTITHLCLIFILSIVPRFLPKKPPRIVDTNTIRVVAVDPKPKQNKPKRKTTPRKPKKKKKTPKKKAKKKKPKKKKKTKKKKKKKKKEKKAPSVKERIWKELEKTRHYDWKKPAPKKVLSNTINDSIKISDFHYTWYISMLFNKINNNWLEPQDSYLKGRGHTCWIAFDITRSGNIENIRVANGSMIESFDTSCMEAVERSNPMPPLPQEYSQSRINVRVKFDITGNT